jgi:addiction module RelE/StbE family toxin
LKIRWTTQAANDRRQIKAYIATDNPMAAAKLDRLFAAATRRLADFPNQGRQGSWPGTRELIPHESYRLIYEVRGQTIWVLALIHTARAWPPTS